MKGNLVTCLLCFLVFFIVICLLFPVCSDNGKRVTAKKLEIVVSRFMEPLDWVYEEPYNKFNIIVYNKGTQIEWPNVPSHVTVRNLSNLGRESGTYLQHIVDNYDNLAPVTVFLPGSFLSDHKRPRAEKTVELALKRQTSVFYGEHVGSIRTAFADFSINDYASVIPINRSANPESAQIPAQIRPFGAWLDARLGQRDAPVVCFYAIFAVARKDILQHSLDFYKRLLEEVNVGSSPEVGHYFERAWPVIFSPSPISQDEAKTIFININESNKNNQQQ